jgi:hypothetical protein
MLNMNIGIKPGNNCASPSEIKAKKRGKTGVGQRIAESKVINIEKRKGRGEAIFK